MSRPLASAPSQAPLFSMLGVTGVLFVNSMICLVIAMNRGPAAPASGPTEPTPVALKGSKAPDSEPRLIRPEDLDRFGNPQAGDVGLARDNDFLGKKLLVWGNLGGEHHFAFTESNPMWVALRKKGFDVRLMGGDFPTGTLNDYDQVWIISYNENRLGPAGLEALDRFTTAGKGVYLLADNVPYLTEAAAAARRWFDTTIQGDYFATKIGYVKTRKMNADLITKFKGDFPIDDHPLLTGVNFIYEGITTSHFTETSKLEVAIRGSDGLPLVGISKVPGRRVVVDCGFTRYFYDAANPDGPQSFITRTAGTLFVLKTAPPFGPSFPMSHRSAPGLPSLPAPASSQGALYSILGVAGILFVTSMICLVLALNQGPRMVAAAPTPSEIVTGPERPKADEIIVRARVDPVPEVPKAEESAPAKPKPVEPPPVEPKREDIKPEETKPVETKPIEPKPVEPPPKPRPVELDRFGNPQGGDVGLARDNEFKGKKVLVWGNLKTEHRLMFNDANPMWLALRKKGFEVRLMDKAFPAASLRDFDQLWIVSYDENQLKAADLIALDKFAAAGKGVYLMADNEPYLAEVKDIARRWFGTTIQGDYYATKIGYVRTRKMNEEVVLKFKGDFPIDDHLLLTGVNFIYEGITTSHFTETGKLQVAIRGSDGKPLVAVSKVPGRRVVVDCGFTRYFYDPDNPTGELSFITRTAGTVRFGENVAAYLAGKGK